MKKRILISTAMILGVFLMTDIPLLAQSTGKSSQSESSRESERETRSSRSASVYVTPEVDLSGIYGFDHGFAYTAGISGDQNTKLSLSKRFSGQSTSKTGTFNIDEGVKKIRVSISGSVAAGRINVEVYLPGRQELKRLTIDDSADISWSQSINIKEGQSRYYGDWTYVIDAQSAEGKYNISISTY